MSFLPLSPTFFDTKMTLNMTRKITSTKPEHNLHKWSEKGVKIRPKIHSLISSLTRILTHKITSTKPEPDQHKWRKVDLRFFWRAYLKRNSARFFRSAVRHFAPAKNYLKNSFDLIFPLFFIRMKTNYTSLINLSVMTSTVCKLYAISITFQIVVL